MRPAPLDLAPIRLEVEGRIDGFLTNKARTAEASGMPCELAEVLRAFVSAGGKRLRPVLCVIGWQAAGGMGTSDSVLQTAASLEMFHAFALIHDDVMDRSAARRGVATVHRALAARHLGGRTQAAAERLGASCAILAGDLALAWSDEMLHTAGLRPAQLAAVLPFVDAMRTEVVYGQYLDLVAAERRTGDVDLALQIAHYKTAKYTCERPLHIGAALGGAPPALMDTLSAYAIPLGEAFQLRDDLLGVFGHPEAMGKSNLDDLREGKHTALLAVALQGAVPGQRDALCRMLTGHASLSEVEAARIRALLGDARTTVEEMISTRHRASLNALAFVPIAPAAADALRTLADQVAWRTS